MKKALKITGIVVGVVVLLVIVLAVTLPFLINPNRFKDDIARMVKEKTGRELVIQGDIKLSIFPWLGVQIGPAELSNAKGFGAVPFAAINETDVHVAFWPLLHKRVEVGEVKLDGLSLDLEHDTEGRSNWQDISEHMARNAASGKAAADEGATGGAVDLSVAGISVTDSQVRWTDAQKHQQYTVSDFTLKMGAFTSGKPLSLEAGFDFTGTNPALQGHADFKGTATADLEGRIYSADDATLELQAKGDAVPGGQTDTSLHWQHAVANLAQGSVALNGLEADAYGLKLQMEAQGKDVTKAPVFSGTLKLARFVPRDLLKVLGYADLVHTRDPAVLGAASASLSFLATPSSVSFSGVDMALDDSHLTGSAALKDFKTKALAFDLDVDQMNADRYLPPPQPGTPDKPREETDLNKVGIPLRTLRNLDVDGHLRVGQFTFMNAKVTGFEMGLSTHEGLLAIKPLSASLYGGSLDGELQVDAREANGDQPVVSETLALKGVQVAGLAQDIAKTDKLSGTVEMNATTRAQGRTVLVLRQTLRGRMSFALKNGALEGVNVWDSIARAYAVVKGQAAPPPAPARTEIANVHGSANIVNGVLSNKDFAALLPFLSLGGEGKLDLADMTVDYNLKGKVTGTPRPAPGQDLSGLKGLTVPLHITGTLSNLSVRPDLGGVAKAKVDEVLDKKKDELKKKAQDKLQDLLGSSSSGG